MVASTVPDNGRVAVVLPQGALFRGGAERAIRKHMLEEDLIEAVIGLAPNLFYGTGLAACVLILRRNKAPDRQGKVLFVNAEQLLRRGRNQNTLEPEHGESILCAYQAFTDQNRLSTVASLNDVAANDFNLNIPLYVAAQHEDEVTFEDALRELEMAYERSRQTRAALESELAKWGLSEQEVQS